MKTTLRWMGLSGVALGLLLGGCSTPPQPRSSMFATPAEVQADPPRPGDYRGAWAYAQARVKAGDFAEAGLYFERAVEFLPSGRTEEGLWERENLTSAAWSWLFCGEHARAVSAARRAADVQAWAAPSPRLMALQAWLLSEQPLSLPAEVRSVIPSGSR